MFMATLNLEDQALIPGGKKITHKIKQQQVAINTHQNIIMLRF